MQASELSRRAGVAIRLAFKDDERGYKQLAGYLEEMPNHAVSALEDAAKVLYDVAGEVLEGRRD